MKPASSVWLGLVVAACATRGEPSAAEGDAPAAVEPTRAAVPDVGGSELVAVLDPPSAAAPAGPVPAEPAAGPPPLVDDDESDDYIVGPPDALGDCEQRLEAAEITWSESRIPVHENRGGIVCGAPEVVRYRGCPASIRWSSSPKLTCGMALSVAKFEHLVQEEAERIFGRRVVEIDHMGTYNCREMAAYPGWVSEHSYGNAIDVKRFVLAGGKEIPVLGRYGDAATGPTDPDSRFLQAVAARAFDEDVFSVVLTPAFDRQHRNHFHLDLARYRVDGTGRP